MGTPDPGAGPTAAVLTAIGDTPGKPRRFFGQFGGRLVMVQVWDAGERLPTGGATGAAKPVLVRLVKEAGEPILRKTLLAAAEKQNIRPGTAVKALAELVRDGELVNPMDHNGYRLPAWRPAPTSQPGLFDQVE